MSDIMPGSPLPWTEQAWYTEDGIEGCRVILDAEGEELARVAYASMMKGAANIGCSEINTAYITVACNAYPQIVAELRQLREQNKAMAEALKAVLPWISGDAATGNNGAARAEKQARAALNAEAAK